MARISLYNFAGLMPRIDPKLLADTYASKAQNVELRRGQIGSTKSTLSIGVSVGANTQSIYNFNSDANSGDGFWFQFDDDVDVVRGAIAGDTTLRTYFTGDGVPKITDASIATTGGDPYPSNAHNLGLPVPDAPTAADDIDALPAGGQELNAAYVITYVSARGEESAPSQASNIVRRFDSGSNDLSNISVASGAFVVTSKRIYRIELTGTPLFVAEIPAAQTTYTDSVKSDELGEAIATGDWVAPEPTMIGLTALPNGGMMGYFGNTLCFCEPYYPHAWPIRYQLAFEYDVVGVALSANGIIVATKGNPYLVVGSDPSSMSQIKLDVVQACSAKRSVVDMGDYVLYASAEGLVAAGGASAQLVTEQFILPDQWAAMIKPSSIIAFRYQGRYLAFYNNGTTQGSFSFHPSTGFLFYDEYAKGGYLNKESGKLYVVQDSAINQWDGGASATYEWESKTWQTPDSEGFVAAKIDADAYPITFKYYLDGELEKTKVVTSGAMFKLPNKKRHRQMRFSVTGNNPISAIQLTTSNSEVQ